MSIIDNIDMSLHEDYIDIKQYMPMYTLCPVCHERAMNPYYYWASEDKSMDTDMDADSNHEYAVKSKHFSIIYTHKKCKILT